MITAQSAGGFGLVYQLLTLAGILCVVFLMSPFRRRLMLTALRSLETHFLRSLLATLGVLIGVGSVVAAMAILEGATNSIIDDFSSLGSSALYVTPEVARVGGRAVGAAQTLTLDDVAHLKRELDDDIAAISSEALDSALVKRFQKSDTFTIVATTDTYFEINSYKARTGRPLSKAESEDEMALVACLGDSVAEKLFGGVDAVGQTIKIRNTAYRVVGVMEKRGNIGLGVNGDDAVFIPVKSGLKRLMNRQWLTWLTIQATEGRELADVQKRIAAVLRKTHNIRVGQPDDFRIYTQEEVLRNLNEATLILKVVFYSIAGISLVVGGIGIMNIMLVSVTERTREIGVRMAVGARRMDILMQFLVEALIISLLGGGFGLLLGLMFTDLLDKVLQGMFTTEITSGVVLTALVTTTVVGVFSGIYPAFKASRLDPVVALRYE